MFATLRDAGFQIAFHAHAEAILGVDFPEVAAQLEAILLASAIPIEEIVGSGGGETKGTQRLRRALHDHGWRKHKFEVTRSIDGVARESISHEVDHIARFPNGVIALEIEWNNKDPFFDRDLENYKRLHADGAISLGILITRGSSLQDGLRGPRRTTHWRLSRDEFPCFSSSCDLRSKIAHALIRCARHFSTSDHEIKLLPIRKMHNVLVLFSG